MEWVHWARDLAREFVVDRLAALSWWLVVSVGGAASGWFADLSFLEILGLFVLIGITGTIVIELVRRYQSWRQAPTTAPSADAGYAAAKDRPDFFANRGETEHAMSFADRLRTAHRIDALFVIGDKFFNAELDEARRVSRIIVPDPNSRSLQRFAEQMGRKEAIARRIEEVTRRAQELNKPIRWAHEFTGYSYLLGDSDAETGWVHIELVLPSVRPQDRPSLTIRKRDYPKLVDAIRRGFEDIWQNHSKPPRKLT